MLTVHPFYWLIKKRQQFSTDTELISKSHWLETIKQNPRPVWYYDKKKRISCAPRLLKRCSNFNILVLLIRYYVVLFQEIYYFENIIINRDRIGLFLWLLSINQIQ